MIFLKISFDQDFSMITKFLNTQLILFLLALFDFVLIKHSFLEILDSYRNVLADKLYPLCQKDDRFLLSCWSRLWNGHQLVISLKCYLSRQYDL